jgi:hypothetical protein
VTVNKGKVAILVRSLAGRPVRASCDAEVDQKRPERRFSVRDLKRLRLT